MTNLQKAEDTILYLILGVTPLLFCNQMTYNFHTPKYLFFQLTIFSAVMIIMLKSEIRVCINLLDSLVLLRLLWMLPLVFFSARYTNLFENVDIFAYLVIFYFFAKPKVMLDKVCFLKYFTSELRLLINHRHLPAGHSSAIFASLQEKIA